MNYKLLTGCFEGEVVEEGHQILDVPFWELDLDLQVTIRAHKGKESKEFETTQEEEWAKQSYEESWDHEETEEPVTLYPISSW